MILQGVHSAGRTRFDASIAEYAHSWSGHLVCSLCALVDLLLLCLCVDFYMLHMPVGLYSSCMPTGCVCLSFALRERVCVWWSVEHNMAVYAPRFQFVWYFTLSTIMLHAWSHVISVMPVRTSDFFLMYGVLQLKYEVAHVIT